MDEADRAQQDSEFYLDLALKQRKQHQGISANECEECGAAIPLVRQQAIQGVKTCVACAEVAEHISQQYQSR